MEDSKTLDISLEDIKIVPEINPILKNLPKLRRQSNNSTCSLSNTINSDNSENLQSCGSVCVYNLQQQLIFNCEFCDLKYGDLDNFKRHLHEAHSLFQLEEEPVNTGKKRQSSKACTAVKKEPLEPPIDLPSTYFTEPLVSCGAVFIFNQQKFHLACGYCDCSKYDNLDMFEKHVKQQHNILEGAHNELNVVPKVEVKEEVFLITEVVEPTEVKVEKEEPLEEGLLNIKQRYSDNEEEEDEDDEENEPDEDDEEFIDEHDEEFIDEDDDDEEGEEDETEDEQNTSKATKRKEQESPCDEPSTSSSAKTKRKRKNEKIECEMCHRRVTRGGLSRHKKIHLRESANIFNCQHCDMTFLQDSELRRHLAIHKNGRFNCEHCKRTFKRRFQLTEHIRTHTGEKPFECEICHKRIRTQASYDIHKKRHLGDAGRNSKCEYCDRTYFTNGDLRKHIKQCHAKEESKNAQPVKIKAVDRVFNCEHCNKNFKRLAYLTEHIRTHTGEKPYECEICQKRFRAQGTYYVHKKRHLGEAGKTKECDYCDNKFLTRIELRRHIDSIHKEEFKTS